ncbi:MAG: GNAT family N-acetyltransferase [Bacteroidia bacterium]
MELKIVNSEREVAQFHAVMDRVYAHDADFIYPLIKDVEEVFHAKSNPVAHAEGTCQRWVLLINGVPSGRIAAFYRDKKVEDGAVIRRGGIGFFECVHQDSAAEVLFQAAENWLFDQQVASIDAPINFGDRDSFWGLLISAKTYPSNRESYNPSYYQACFESRQYAVSIEQTTYEITNATFNFPRFSTIAQRVMGNPEYRFEFFKYSELEAYAGYFAEVYNQGWAHHEDFKPIQASDVYKRLKSIKPAMPERLAIFAFAGSRPIGFFVSILEVNQVFKSFKGRMSAWNGLKFLWQKGRIDKAKGIVFGIIPEYQNKGIETGMIMRCYEAVQHLPQLKSMELAWIGDFNPKMLSMLQSLGAELTKVHHTYRKEIPSK